MLGEKVSNSRPARITFPAVLDGLDPLDPYPVDELPLETAVGINDRLLVPVRESVGNEFVPVIDKQRWLKTDPRVKSDAVQSDLQLAIVRPKAETYPFLGDQLHRPRCILPARTFRFHPLLVQVNHPLLPEPPPRSNEQSAQKPTNPNPSTSSSRVA